MASVQASGLPAGALLGAYAESGAYTDCYVIELPRLVTQSEFVEAFYTTFVFRIERWMIAVFLSRPSTASEAKRLAVGDLNAFAAWTVEQRAPNQLLLAAGNTRSWLMVSPGEPSRTATKLYFGSAVVPRRGADSSASRMGWQFRVLLGFHKVYSQVLLAASCQRLAAVL
jgi:hypothetical protein